MPQPLPDVKYFSDESLLRLYFCLRPPTILAQLEDPSQPRTWQVSVHNRRRRRLRLPAELSLSLLMSRSANYYQSVY